MCYNHRTYRKREQKVRIGLAGIPGSGKTQLANKIKEHFENQNESCAIIDGYVENLEKSANLALGFTAAYAGNIHIALERAGLERRLVEENDHIVTCGTLFENASYAAQSLETDYNFISNEKDKADFVVRSEASMRVFGCFYIDLLKYDYLFHLTPLSPMNDDKMEDLERNLQSAFQAFNLMDYTPLMIKGETNEEIVNNRLKDILEVIGANNAEKQNIQA